MCIGHLELHLQYQVSKRQGIFETATEFNSSIKCDNLVKNDFSAVNHFFELVLQAHVVAAAMEYFGMSSVDQLSTRHVFPLTYHTASTSTAKEYLSDTVDKFVDEFVQHYFDSILSLRRDVLSPAPEEEAATGVQDNVPTTDTNAMESLTMHVLLWVMVSWP